MKRAWAGAAALAAAAWLGGCCSNKAEAGASGPTLAEQQAKEPLVGSTPNAERLEREKGPLFQGTADPKKIRQ